MLNERLTKLVEPVVETLGYELVLLEFNPYQGNAVLRLYIDAETGVTLADCERVSREVAAALDVEDPITQAYSLEVSSPGLDRPLVKPAHYLKFLGERVQVRLLNPLEGRRKFRGVLLDYGEGVITMQTESGQFRLPLVDVERTRLLPDMENRRAGHE